MIPGSSIQELLWDLFSTNLLPTVLIIQISLVKIIKNAPWRILVPRAVACDNLPLRASTHLREAVPFFNRKFHRYFLLKRKLRQEYRHSAGVFTSVTIFRSPVVFFYERYPFGFLDCQFHASRHISSSVLFASQPSSTFAFVASE